ncbi:MAG: phosphoglucosamine mutase [Rikenellaceae bacterium]|jgi:phosphomannomutase|nr:phosphoglucosamine mutase [Rikenellaceae bacterium]
MALIKSISGIRGTIGGAAGENLTPTDIVRFTSAYARLLRERDGSQRQGGERRLRVVVGRDARISGEMVRSLVVGTLMGCGVEVTDVGLCTTPGVEMAVVARRADGGVILTASHNPRQWNALKLLDGSGEFLDAAAGARLLELAAEDCEEFPDVDNIGRLTGDSFDDEHIAAVLAMPLANVEAVRARRLKVVVDAVNSVGGIVVPALLRALGAEIVELNCEPTGEFAHNPEPLPENLGAISAAVVASGADLGVVVDPDVDRLALVCEDGTMFGEEYTLVAVADYVLAHTQGNTVSNLSSSRALRDITLRRGGLYSAAAVGEVNVVAQMKRSGAVIGGEGNGGVIYPALHYGRDALAGIALFLSHLASCSAASVSALRRAYPQYYISKNRVETAPGTDLDALLARVKEKYKDQQITDIDGVKIDFPTSWAHLRRSNTEPIVRIYAEGADPAADEVANRTTADALAEQIMRDLAG